MGICVCVYLSGTSGGIERERERERERESILLLRFDLTGIAFHCYIFNVNIGCAQRKVCNSIIQHIIRLLAPGTL